jgi:hypothetical protein
MVLVSNPTRKAPPNYKGVNCTDPPRIIISIPHCPMALVNRLKGADCNCDHEAGNVRTKESLVECLEQFMVLASNPTRKAPPNYMEGNCKGLWDYDHSNSALSHGFV